MSAGDARDRTGLVFALRTSDAPRGAPSWLAPPGDSQVFPVAESAPIPEPEAPPAEPEVIAPPVARVEEEPVSPVPAYPDLRPENEELRRRLGEQARAFASLRTAVLAASEDELVGLACSVAERAVGRELTISPGLLREWVREASSELAVAGDVTISLAPDLAALLDETARRSLAALGSVEIDPSFPSMYCEVRSGASVVPASAGARVGAIAAHLGVTE